MRRASHCPYCGETLLKLVEVIEGCCCSCYREHSLSRAPALAVTNAVLKELLKRCRAELIDDGHEYNGLCPEPGSRGSRDPDCDACTLIVEIERETP